MNREITLNHKYEKGGRRSILDAIEQYSKILAAIAVPAVIAIGGWWLQRQLAENATRQEYVKIAVSILSEKGDPSQADLRTWATHLLNSYSPVPLPPGSQSALISGSSTIPAPANTGGIFAVPSRILAHFETNKGKSTAAEAQARKVLEDSGFRTDTDKPLGLGIDHARITYNPQTSDAAETAASLLQSVGIAKPEMKEDPNRPTGEVFVYIP